MDEILAAEKASDDRKRSRMQGFNKMHERDQAVQVLSNGVTMLWHVPKHLNEAKDTIDIDGKEVEITTYPPSIPEDSFALVMGGKKYLFDLEEFKTWLRWA